MSERIQQTTPTKKSKPIEALYNSGFFARRGVYNFRAPIVAGCVAYMWMKERWGGPLKSVCDVGCAVGDLVKAFGDVGLQSYGIEGASACVPFLVCDKEHVLIWDMGRPLFKEFYEAGGTGTHIVAGAPDRFDLVTCFEVLEHIPPENADVLVENLCLLSDRLLISACPPPPPPEKANGSKYHCNEQPPEYWMEKFSSRGYSRGKLREVLRHGSGVEIQRGLIVENLGLANPKITLENDRERAFRNMLSPWRWVYGIRAWWENVLYFEKEKTSC